MPATRSDLSRFSAQVAATLAACALWAAAYITRFDGPMVGYGDINCWEYTGLHFAEHWRWLPWPHLELQTDALLYPFGINAALLPWGFERDAFFAIAQRLWGVGPWLQLYVFLSLAITSLGLALLLGGRFGYLRTALIGLAVAFLNHYLARKMPVHLSFVTVHWLLLSVAFDMQLADVAVREAAVPLRQWLIRALLLLLTFGLELGYVAGFGLLSGLLTLAFVAALWLVRHRGAWRAEAADAWQSTRVELGGRAHWGLLLAIATLAWLWLPSCVAIAHAVADLDTADATGLHRAASPLRLLLPYLPGWHPLARDWGAIFGDTVETDVELTPGWTFWALAVVGLSHTPRRRWPVLLPAAAFALLVLSWDPVTRPTLQQLPFFRFARVPGRVSLLLPLLLALPALTATWPPWRRRPTLAATAFGLLALAELATAATLPRGPSLRIAPWTADHQRYMQTIAAAPGEALLSWPLCVSTGNGVGRQLCQQLRLFNDSSWRRFHGKKVVGAYLGRLAPSQLRDLEDSGLGLLVQPQPGDKARRQRCLRPEELDFLQRFFEWYAFAGLEIYADALADPRCVAQLTARFGAAAAEAELPGAGRALFVPRRSPLPKAGGGDGPAPRYEPPRPVTLDLLAGAIPGGVAWHGFDKLEFLGAESWRWATAARAALQLRRERAEWVELRWRVEARFAGQTLAIAVDGVRIASHRAQRRGHVLEGRHRFWCTAASHGIGVEHGGESAGDATSSVVRRDPRNLVARHLLWELVVSSARGADGNIQQ